MGKLQKNQQGLGAVEVVLVLVVVILIGAVGWRIYKDHHKNTATTVPPVVSTPQPKSTQSCDKSCLDTAFQTIKIPPTFTFVSKSWSGQGKTGSQYGPVPSWTYIYTVPATTNSQLQQQMTALYKAETGAGYTLRQIEAGGVTAYSKEVKAEVLNGYASTIGGGSATVSIKLTVQSY